MNSVNPSDKEREREREFFRFKENRKFSVKMFYNLIVSPQLFLIFE